ncbi:hypothetical protein PSACC_03625 [Paramicrosporidium saccamoebae]|uniref:Lariat debranching enzyme C-terminal domain-containing protein n=1 Tax=Paramicrosporidium saccamoebae TaxID=1246581 RepID=A0A2H9TG71_9FUNG|nr:hypothetical protein PSACC_03625 [Paramicrosporidium saccamoebae]
MRVAIQGCGHGNLNSIYAALAKLQNDRPVDLLLICGDFQAVRHEADLETLACPPKYRHLGDFPEYYSGRRKAPVLTLFIGGNHEASSHLWDLYHGGWVAPNMYFLGFSGCVRFGGLRISGISGLYDPRHIKMGYYERMPYTGDMIRSIYHTREVEYRKLELLQGKTDVFMSHEWPHKIYEHGNLNELLRCKPHFRNDIQSRGIGAPPLAKLLKVLQPIRWYAAHMHVEFKATVQHDQNVTEFLALDKCLPGRRHMQIVDIPAAGPMQLEYDEEWLSIVRAMDPFLSLNRTAPAIPDKVDLTDHVDFVRRLKESRSLKISERNSKPSDTPGKRTTLLQTSEFCRMLQIQDRWGLPFNLKLTNNPDEICSHENNQ